MTSFQILQVSSKEGESVKLINGTKGAISIFLVIILVPMMTVSSLFVDASKVKLARGVAESAGDLALNTALTDYDTVLKDLYGLFATAQDTTELFEKLEDYFRTSISSSGVSDEDTQSYVDMIMAQLGLVASDSETADLLNMQLVDFDVHKRTDATLANPTVLEKQIVDFMKYRAPINTGLSFLSSIKSFSTLSKQTELVDKRQEYYKAEETVMQNAQKAWKHINEYNKSGFIQNANYFSEMEGKFSGYEAAYYDIAKKIIRDLYDAQSYGSFTSYSYYISFEEVEVNGSTKTVPVFYTNSAKTSKKPLYTELTKYSDTNKATAANIKTALSEYYTAFNAYNTATEQLMEYNANTYGQQFLIQTNRRSLYTTWINSMVKLYEKYNALRHAATFAGEKDDGTSVMTTSEKMLGESSSHPYSYYYDKFMNGFDATAAVFNNKLGGSGGYNSTLAKYAQNTNTSTDAVAASIAIFYGETTGYRTTISDAKTNVDAAITYLGYVFDAVKTGGTLDQKSGEWRTVAGSSELKGTSMAKQDLAEIGSLSTYLNQTDVQKLIDRLNNISTNLGKLLNEIDSYTFFGTKIVEISDYSTMINILKNKIGDGALKTVPTDKTQLENKINQWCQNKFVIGSKVDTSWKNQSGTQAKLSGTGTDKLNFYSYLYTHFNTGDVSSNTTEKTEDKTNGENLYNDIKGKSASATESSTQKADDGNVATTNELSELSGRPSNGGGDATASIDVKTGDNAAKDTSAGLSSMFSNLAKAAMDLGTDLRDKLYVSDYILSMFSYDTIEKEFAKKNTKEGAVPQTLTLVPIDADHNFAYGREVEYIIFGGSNSSNVAKAYGSIYGIRFGFNVIYAFMDSSIRDTAFAIATPISAATLGVIPVPLIQAVIIVGIACAESAWDLNDIRNGESVPLFKTQETWHCSINGLINEAKGIAGSLIQEGTSYVIDEGARKLGEVLDMTDEELNKYLETGASELTGYIGDSYDTLITRHANTAIQKLTTLANNALEEYALDPATNMTDYVSKGLDEWLASEASGVDTSSDLGYIVKSEAVKIIKSQFIAQVIEAIKNAKNDVSSEISNLGATLMDQINDIRDQIIQKVNNGCDKVKQYKSEMISKLQGSMNEGAQNLKDTLNEQIDGIFGSSAVEGSDNTGLSSLISFSYSDYLRLFLMIGLYTNESGIILRTADVIQANMAKKTGNNDYRLTNSAAYVELSATIQVKPTLLALPLFANVEGNPSTNTNWYTFEYKSIKGY